MSNWEPLVKPPDIAEADYDLIERFVTSFNRVDRFLRELYHADDRLSFGRLVEIHLRKPALAQRRRPAGLQGRAERDGPRAELPLSLSVHAHAKHRGRDQRICDHLLRPERLIPRFNRHVWTIGLHDSVAELFRLVEEHACSKFPVFEEGKFQGLITEHGITHWLARYACNRLGCRAVAGRRRRRRRRRRSSCQRSHRRPPAELAPRNAALQAVLITADGQDTGRLLGIATWGDALQLMGE